MLFKELFWILFIFVKLLHYSKACTIPGISGNPGFLRLSVKDIDRGVFHRVTTSNILSITASNHSGDPLQNGPYITAELVDNDLILSLHDNFEHYEENETALSMGFTINFSCDGNPNTAIVVLTLNVVDTNNNKPIFTPPDVSFMVVTPLAPGFKITGCNDQIVVRDIDLTTTDIIFDIEENDYFEIVFDEESTVANTKTFLGILRTKSFIRSIPKPISLQISATDNDRTNDPPLTTTTTLTIKGDPIFTLPDDLIFTNAFYLASYTADHEVINQQQISLEQGFDDEVTFILTGDLVDHFRLAGSGNSRTIEVSTPLPEAVFNEGTQVILVVTAARQDVSPTTAAIIIELPQPKNIEFESLHYEARIIDNSLSAPNLVLSRGYEDGFNVNIISDYSSNFQYEIVERNQIRLQMAPLSEEILINNNFITLHVVARSGTGSATAIISLDIIKNDLTTPRFGENTYIGTYNSEDGLDIEDFLLVQGYDETVSFDTEGEHGDFFTITSNANKVTLIPNIPTEVLQSHNQLIFTIHASKPRTVGARSTVIVNLPPVPGEILRFENDHYIGQLEEGTLTLQDIVLEEGYAHDVNFNILGDLREHFLISSEANIVKLKINPENEIPNINNLDFIVLEIVANRPDIISATTVIVIDVINYNESIPTPTFRKTYYDGIYTSNRGLEFDHVIDLEHGFDKLVSFSLDGDDSDWFKINNNENDVRLTVVPDGIPTDVLKNSTHFIFSLIATRVGTLPGRTAIVITLPEINEITILKFQNSHYRGSLQDDILNLEPITLIEGHSEDISYELSGEHQSLFRLNTNNAPTLSLELIEPLPESLEGVILLEIRASGSNAVTAFTTIVLETPTETAVDVLTFSEAYYSGSYTQEDGLDFTDIITLSSGYDDSVTFDLSGTHSQYFGINQDGNSITISVPDEIPISVLNNNQHLTLTIIAGRPGAVTGVAAIVIALPDDFPDLTILRFEHTIYRGSVDENTITLGPITLLDGFSENINFELGGEHRSLFRLNKDNAPTLSLEIIEPLPGSLEGVILLEVRASGSNAVTAFTTIVLETPTETAVDVLTFSEAYYSGSYTQEDGLDFTDIITLSSGYDDSVTFDLSGTHSQYFGINQDGNSITISVPDEIPISVLNNNQHLTLTIMAERPGAVTGVAAIVIALPDDFPDLTILRFEHTIYRGSVDKDTITLGPITLLDGFSENINFELGGEHRSLFRLNTDNAPTLSLEIIEPLPGSLEGVILLEVRASGSNAVTAFTSIVLETPTETAVDVLTFSEAYYSGSYTQEDGLDFTDIITLSTGYDGSVTFDLSGTYSQYFGINRDGNSITISVLDEIPISVLNNNQHLTLTIMAERPGAVTGVAAIIIALPDGPSTDVFFLRALYHGTFELGILRHDDITLVGYSGSEVKIHGELSELFTAVANNGEVTIRAVEDNIIIPIEVQQVAFELKADVARTAIVINIIHRGETVPPEVEFLPTSYVFRVDVTETGIIGIVSAVTNNGENIQFSLEIDNEHLAERLSVNSEGELRLGAPANSGRYHFNIVATTFVSGVSATANAQLTVDAITICGDDEFVVPPLIIIERDEEEAHDDLVVVNEEIAEKCQFEMVNHWPLDQIWLTVNNTGLHAKKIDREDESIAFMTVSQIQVELILHCADDNVKRTKRSVINNVNYSKTMMPFEYGSKQWVLADSILYNSRRSFVNLIVNDINDNYPIFMGKENEPIVVGYPQIDLVDIVRPRALAELKATDKDIGINAELLYWSDEPILTVAGKTGAVHVRNNMAHLLKDNTEYVISATDKAGAEDGNDGSIKILVKLLDINNVAVLTIRDAFADSEQAILRELSKNLNYDVRILRSTVISSEFEDSKQTHRNIRTAIDESRTSSGGASLQLFVYGLVNRTPITASQLVTDINNSGITTIQIVDNIILEDHIESNLCRNIGLFAATITLSIILFLIIVFIIFWYFYKIRKSNNYEKFSDTKSLSNQSNDDAEVPKIEGIARAKINIDEIKKSERRLQEILNTPVEDKPNITSTSNTDIPTETIIDIPVVEKNVPIVIQSIDKLKDAKDSSDEEDEYGEIKTSLKRRKSVVTFNENVEKIIHVDDIDDMESVPDFEIDRL